ncbi:putative patatin/cPLA2 family phospholipase [Natranaerovirga hydrolytica]|uniref:Putative patatin/cPLA2 family phospholipase n=1 Tax=Natranaerovirga hydrolytica TaxID=680378 RepID=A0A4R1MTF4_9FIRM|nr:patatin family protein [Natranaerovirga hydrolytica]TCK93243.1 putative patatin/cPLA2 family phospholipase [Natranaerovirga hydrolytica]
MSHLMEDKTALVVEGGAMRGIFSTGILDAFLIHQFNPFDIHIGVSAGSSNLAAYLANMYQRNYKVYVDYSVRPDFISWRKFFLGKHLIDLDWLWDITIKEMRLDLDRISQYKNYYVGLTEVNSGKTHYIKPDKDNLEEVIKASSAIPIFYRNTVNINGAEYVDGGVSDPIPVKKAYELGAKKIMVIRSRDYHFNMKKPSKKMLLDVFLRKYPQVKLATLKRHRVYRESIEFIRKPPKGIEIIEVNPPDEFETNRLTQDIEILKKDYQLGYDTGINIIKKWNHKA